jgi:hypothetical protein
VFFSVERFGRFCCGFWEKRVAERGFLMVNSWWNAGEGWHADVTFLVRKSCH